MRHSPKSKSVQRANNSSVITDYLLDDKHINFVIANIQGRYPEKGYVINQECKLLAYVQTGNGKLVVEENELPLQPGDVVLIHAGEKYYWDGKLQLHISCTPAWYPEQHKYSS